MKLIQSFFAKIRNAWFVDRLETEIYHRIFSHLENEGDYGYPFNSADELRKLCDDPVIVALAFVQEIERDIVRMPKAYSEAFRYILYRELKANQEMSKARMRMFLILARRRVYHEPSDMRFVATRA